MYILLIVVLLLLYISYFIKHKNVTIVSAYYDIPSKRRSELYHHRLKRFLGNMNCNMIFYTSSDMLETIKTYRGQYNDRSIIYTINLEDLNAIKMYGIDFWKEQCEKSIEPAHVNIPYLGALWYSKKDFLKDAIKKNPFSSTHFAWVDAGIIENEINDVLNIQYDVLGDDERMNIYSINGRPDMSVKFFESTPNIVAGDTFFGSIGACLKHIENYENTINKYLENDVCIFDDQNILTSTYVTYENDYNIEYGEWRLLFKKLVGEY